MPYVVEEFDWITAAVNLARLEPFGTAVKTGTSKNLHDPGPRVLVNPQSLRTLAPTAMIPTPNCQRAEGEQVTIGLAE